MWSMQYIVSCGSSPLARGLPVIHPLIDRVSGSSPLARGLLHTVDREDFYKGIIPARAGFTRGVVGDRSGYPDHPRSRGVYISSGNADQ